MFSVSQRVLAKWTKGMLWIPVAYLGTTIILDTLSHPLARHPTTRMTQTNTFSQEARRNLRRLLDGD